jgi:hypothetical protein
MRHYGAKADRAPLAAPATTKRAVLQGRKRGLELMISSRLAAARRRGETADVKDLSACLRGVKAEIAKLGGGDVRP